MAKLPGENFHVRGGGPRKLANALALATLQSCISLVLAWECFGGSAMILRFLLGERYFSQAYELSGWKAGTLLYANCLYTARVTLWVLFVSHTDTVQAKDLVYVLPYICLFQLSQPFIACMPFALDPLPLWMWVCGVLLATLGHALVMLADFQLARFKTRKQEALASGSGSPLVLDKGLWALCRHPNYFFHVVGIFGIGLCTGWVPFAMAWLLFEVHFVYTKSGPGHEAYMAGKYGEEWAAYERTTSFFIPLRVLEGGVSRLWSWFPSFP
ncbi:unnamed protein product [Effrenium voratum]|nr:unnamed protein product [Effrenium voratum]